MTATSRSGLTEPPRDLGGFPAAAPVDHLHRLSEYPGIWWYSNVADVDSDGGGRFDLSGAEGTCYLAHSLDGALIEKLLRTRTKVVVAERLGELFHASVAVRTTPHTADLTASAATGYGLNAEIHTTLDYPTTRRWASALRRAGWRALRYLLRGDPAARSPGSALFGTAGVGRRAPAGMTTAVAALDRDHAARLLQARGVEVRPIPAAVPILRPADPNG